MGKLSDKLLNAFSMGNDEYDDDEYDDEYEDEYEDDDDYEEEREKGGLFSRMKKSAPAPKEESRSFSAPARSNRSQEVCIFKPSSMEDSREITETLLQGKAVVINFEGLHVEISQRIIDFISGSCYALDGNLQKISNYIFIATPDSVDISGDFQDLMGGDNNSFEISGFKSPMF